MQGSAAATAIASTPVARLHALFKRGWQRDLADDPLTESYVGETL